MKLADLDSNKHTAKGKKLADLKSQKFKIAFGTELENKFCFDTNKPKKVTDGLHKFLKETVYKDLSISMVDQKYLRTRGNPKEKVKYGTNSQLEIQHYGFDKNPFRIFGFYDDKGYFNVTRLDIDHKTHK
ncbi:MAG6450 family protein [Mammaliicoccus sciuri]|uniref:MAG6450 family protein n=1 Tax=Mammaliicoccus sciuri TaxID=1296 RepID=UPI000CD0D731|nr:hypothetical protein [Mammaliicoccus sciuri]PNZ25270.1 hypothetical protein CD114_11065 [Mammaliicoccus sciuri]